LSSVITPSGIFNKNELVTEVSPLIPNSLNEKDLIKGCLEGNRVCQKDLFELYAPKMMSVCRRYARHHLEAQDMMQEGFIKMFTNLHKFSHEGSFEGWVRRIMINTALKKVSRKSFKNEEIGISDHYDNSVDETVLAKMSADELLVMVEELPDGYRVVFNMYVMEGYSHKEIGEALNIGESTSRSQLVKARRILQNKIIESQKIAV